jgi:serine/threonine protein kinase
MSECTRCGLVQPGRDIALCPRCLLSDDADESAPEAPPGIALEEEIGRGGMGRVFRARQLKLDRIVAVKYLPFEVSLDPSFEARFAREARALAKLAHPHVVAIHDFGTSPIGDSYLVMEFVPGGTLAEQIPLPPSDALRVTRELCSALAYAHAQGIVHRDIKPDNVLFSAGGAAKLADFGIARLVEAGGAPITSPLQVFGTPGYVPPETRLGAAPHPTMDVFALGVLLHVMLTAELPDATLSLVSPRLKPLLARLLAEDPAKRPQHAGEVARELAELDGLGAGATLADTATPLPRLEPSSLVDSADLSRMASVPALVVDQAPPPAGGLPPDEVSWLRAVALTLSGATALSLHALLLSVTPRTQQENELFAFVVFGSERLADGRIHTRARFEVIPVLMAAGGWALAIAAYGLLRRHWRQAGLDRPAPEQKLTGTRRVLIMAAILNILFVGRWWLQLTNNAVLAAYLPVLGGLLELGMLYLVWTAVLEAARISRPLMREGWLWVGLAFALLPPGVAFVRMLGGAMP